MAYVAVPWFAIETTGSVALASVVIAALTLPLVLIGIPAGAFADRVDLKRLLMVCNLGQGAAMASIPLLHTMGHLSFTGLVALAFVTGVFLAPYHSGLMALIPRVVDPGRRSLARANAAVQAGLQSARVTGPLIGGGLIAAYGPFIPLFVNAASFGVAAIAISAVRPRPRTDPPRTGRLMDEMAEGLRFVRGNPTLLVTISFAVTMSFLFTPALDVLLPAYAKRVLDSPLLLGFMLASFGAGALAGALLYTRFAPRLFRGPRLVLLFVGPSLPFFAIPFTPISPWIGIVAWAIIGFFYSSLQILFITRLQEWTPDGMRARVFSTFITLVLLATPLGLLVAGPAIEYFGPTVVFYAIGAGLTVGGLFFGSLRIVRRDLSPRADDDPMSALAEDPVREFEAGFFLADAIDGRADTRPPP